MRVCVTLLLLLGLLFHQLAVSTALTSPRVHVVGAGGTVTVKCQLYCKKCQKIFCKNDCNTENVLVKTHARNACNGRFCIVSRFLMEVSIANVSESDAGPYQCAVDEGRNKETFRIQVTNSVTTLGPVITPNELGATTSSELLLLILVPVALIIASVLIYHRKRKLRNNDRTTRNSEDALYENCPAPATKPADNIYQTLCAHTRDQDIYSSLQTKSPPH